jgi:hypothetical protein
LKTVWNWLQGKKTTIATISGVVIVYMLNSGTITANTAQLITGILAVLGISANVANSVTDSKK